MKPKNTIYITRKEFSKKYPFVTGIHRESYINFFGGDMYIFTK